MDNGPVTKADLKAAIEEIKEYVDERTHDAETLCCEPSLTIAPVLTFDCAKWKGRARRSTLPQPSAWASWSAA